MYQLSINVTKLFFRLYIFTHGRTHDFTLRGAGAGVGEKLDQKKRRAKRKKDPVGSLRRKKSLKASKLDGSPPINVPATMVEFAQSDKKRLGNRPTNVSRLGRCRKYYNLMLSLIYI